MVNLPTLHRRRDALCKVYFAKMKSNDHELNALLPNGRSVPFALRLCNKLPITRAKINRYKNSLIPWLNTTELRNFCSDKCLPL